MLIVKCPNANCGGTYGLAEEHRNRRFRCKKCGSRFRANAETLAEANETADWAPVELIDEESPRHTPQPFGVDVPKSLGRFQINGCLGRGAFGVVYRAADPLLSRDVAIKVAQQAVLQNPERVARFLREPKAAAQLRHPHIVPVYDAGVEGNVYYIATAFIEGQTLEKVIADDRPDFRRAAELVLDLADALDYAHGLGVVHRDVKPANIMVDVRGDALLMDFGLARLASAEAEKLTQDGKLMGTAAYMPPEQVTNKLGEVGPASDQYSLGVVLYELLCGERPFSGPIDVVLFNAIHSPPPPPRSHAPAVPRDLETICLKTLSKAPSARYGRCRELADDLRRWLEDRPISARRMGVAERMMRWSRRNPVMAALCGMVGLLAILASAAAIGLQQSRGALQRALGDSEQHARSAQAALDKFHAEEDAKKKIAADLAAREADLNAKEEELHQKQIDLDELDKRLGVTATQLQEKDETLKEREDRISALTVDLRKTEGLVDNEKARVAAAESAAPWAAYIEQIGTAREAYLTGHNDQALAALQLCSEDKRGWEWSFLRATCADECRTWSLTPEKDKLTNIRELKFSPDGKNLILLGSYFRGTDDQKPAIGWQAMVIDTIAGMPLGQIERPNPMNSIRFTDLSFSKRGEVALIAANRTVDFLTLSDVEPKWKAGYSPELRGAYIEFAIPLQRNGFDFLGIVSSTESGRRRTFAVCDSRKTHSEVLLPNIKSRTYRDFGGNTGLELLPDEKSAVLTTAGANLIIRDIFVKPAVVALPIAGGCVVSSDGTTLVGADGAMVSLVTNEALPLSEVAQGVPIGIHPSENRVIFGVQNRGSLASVWLAPEAGNTRWRKIVDLEQVLKKHPKLPATLDGKHWSHFLISKDWKHFVLILDDYGTRLPTLYGWSF